MRRCIAGRGSEYNPCWSPDGRWLAYFSAEKDGDWIDIVGPTPSPGAGRRTGSRSPSCAAIGRSPRFTWPAQTAPASAGSRRRQRPQLPANDHGVSAARSTFLRPESATRATASPKLTQMRRRMFRSGQSSCTSVTRIRNTVTRKAWLHLE